MAQPYGQQCSTKLRRLERALGRYGLRAGRTVAEMLPAELVTGYRRRAKLVVARRPRASRRGESARAAEVAVGLYQRNDNQRVVDITDCQVLSPTLRQIVQTIRELAGSPPSELSALLTPAGAEGGVLTGLDIRELRPPEEGESGGGAAVLLTLVLKAEHAAALEELRSAAVELRRRLPVVAGLAANLRHGSPQQSNTEFVPLSGCTDGKDALGTGYQLVSHTSFLHVHQGQANRLYELLALLVERVTGGRSGRVLDLYGGTGAIALSLAQRGHQLTLVESYPPAAALAVRAAQAQRLPVEVVTGDVASVTRVLAAAHSSFDVAVANPPRRGLSPAARESLAALQPSCAIYVACDLDNLSRDLDHLARLGYALDELHQLDMLPLTEEVEVVATLRRGPLPAPAVLYQDDELVALDKAAYEPVLPQQEYPGSLIERARPGLSGAEWQPILEVEAGTSGVCLFSRTSAAAARWEASLRKGGRLVYLAAARGVTPAKGAITRELRGSEEGRPARTRYRRLTIGGGHSVLRVVPERQQAHQIRRHLAAIGHPVLGDARYGHPPTNRYFEEKHGLDRSFLHLVRVEIEHPLSGERLLIESPLPADLRAALARASDESVLEYLEKKRALGGKGPRPVAEPPPSSVEPSPLSVRDEELDAVASSGRRGPDSGRDAAPDLDEAPRTVRGELLDSGEDDE